MKKILPFLAIVIMSHPNIANSQDENSNFIPSDLDQKKVTISGWDKYLTVGLYGNLSQNNNVVAKEDGQSTTLGFKLSGGIDYGSKKSHWINSMNILFSYSKNPVIAKYLKSEDMIEFDSIYKYYLDSISWAGVFAQGNVSTAGFPGYDTQPTLTTYRKVSLDGSEEIIETTRIRLTDEFNPLKIRESVGLLTTPFDTETFMWDIKVGLGLRQVLANDQYIIKDNEDTAEKELVEIESFEKAGYEIGTELSGSMSEKKVSYSLKANVLFPFYESLDDEDRTTFEKRVIDISGKTSFHLVEWASIDYLLTVSRDPGISDTAQTSQSLLFSLNKTIAARQSIE